MPKKQSLKKNQKKARAALPAKISPQNPLSVVPKITAFTSYKKIKSIHKLRVF